MSIYRYVALTVHLNSVYIMLYHVVLMVPVVIVADYVPVCYTCGATAACSMYGFFLQLFFFTHGVFCSLEVFSLGADLGSSASKFRQNTSLRLETLL